MTPAAGLIAPCLDGVARLLAHMGRWSGVAMAARHSLQVRDSIQMRRVLGDALFRRSPEGFRDAERVFRDATAAFPDDVWSFQRLGECLARQRRFAEARDAFSGWFSRWLESAEGQALKRQQQAAAGRGLPAILLVAMQKSASEFVRDVIQDELALPLIYTGIGTVPIDCLAPIALRQLAAGGAICRSHTNAGQNLSAMADAGITRLVLHTRDPRQTTLSWTHMIRKLSDADFNYACYMYDPPLPIAFRAWTFEQQLEWSIAYYLPGQLGWLEDWAAALDRPPIPIKALTFESLVQDPPGWFGELLRFFGVTGVDLRALGSADPSRGRNFRLGRTDEWREVFTAEQRARVEPRVGPLAERFGWAVR